MRANGFGYKTKSYEWMTHKSFHEVTRAECRDWMKVNIEGKKKKKKEAALLHYARCIRPSSTERVAGWICIHGVDPWENVSLGCTVSHIRSHLENHLPTFLCSSSLYPPLALLVHSRITPPPKEKKKTHSQTSFIPRLCDCLCCAVAFLLQYTLLWSEHSVKVFWGSGWFVVKESLTCERKDYIMWEIYLCPVWCFSLPLCSY